MNPNFLALASDQSLRTTTIVGRPDLGKPDWRANVSDHPMSPQEISDVVAWLVALRANKLVVGQDAANSPASSIKVADGLKRE